MSQTDIEKNDDKLLLDNITNIIKEVIEPSAVDVSTIVMNNELSPLLWIGETMIRDVRETLLRNVKQFIEFSELQTLKFLDIILTGSMANYNYSDKSDIDIHIVLDFKQLSDDEEFVSDYLDPLVLTLIDLLEILVFGYL